MSGKGLPTPEFFAGMQRRVLAVDYRVEAVVEQVQAVLVNKLLGSEIGGVSLFSPFIEVD